MGTITDTVATPNIPAADGRRNRTNQRQPLDCLLRCPMPRWSVLQGKCHRWPASLGSSNGASCILTIHPGLGSTVYTPIDGVCLQCLLMSRIAVAIKVHLETLVLSVARLEQLSTYLLHGSVYSVIGISSLCGRHKHTAYK